MWTGTHISNWCQGYWDLNVIYSFIHQPKEEHVLKKQFVWFFTKYMHYPKDKIMKMNGLNSSPDHFVKTLNPISILSYAVHHWVELKAWNSVVLWSDKNWTFIGLLMIDHCNSHVEHVHIQL